jgi:hypothetical protein
LDVIPETFDEVVEFLEDDSNHHILFTNQAKRSIRDCLFNDVNRVWRLLHILDEDLSRSFKEGYNVDLVHTRLKKEAQATYVANTSEITLGKNSGYEALYKNKKVIGKKHVGIGNSRDPQRCFRLYFDWDDEHNKFIIVNAGAHLDNSLT